MSSSKKKKMPSASLTADDMRAMILQYAEEKDLRGFQIGGGEGCAVTRGDQSFVDHYRISGMLVTLARGTPWTVALAAVAFVERIAERVTP